MRMNYAGNKRRRELEAKGKKEAKAAKLAERRALKAQGIDPSAEPSLNDSEDGPEAPQE